VASGKKEKPLLHAIRSVLTGKKKKKELRGRRKGIVKIWPPLKERRRGSRCSKKKALSLRANTLSGREKKFTH